MTNRARPETNANPLLHALQHKLLEWAATCPPTCFTLCDPDPGLWPLPRRAAPEALLRKLPPEYLVRHPITTKRVAVKRHQDGKDKAIRGFVSGVWPGENLKANEVPYIICVLEDRAELRVGNFMFYGQEGDILFVPPGVPKSDGAEPHFAQTADDSRHAAVLWLSPAGASIGCSICHSQGERHINLPNESGYVTAPQLMQLFGILMHELAGARAFADTYPETRSQNGEIVRHLFLALIGGLAREIAAGRILRFAHQGPEHEVSDNQDAMGRALEYVRTHLNQELTLDHMARFCLLSRSQFTRQFRQRTGTSFANFVIQERLKEAQRLLKETDWPVDLICTTIGIHNSRLRALFREHGLPSPRAFRNAK